MSAFTTAALLLALQFGQSASGELRLVVRDSSGLPVACRRNLLDAHQARAINRVGSDTLQQRISTLPGRSVADVVNTQPGWLLEANGILHPRGSDVTS